jgi:hypothetical protein
MVDGLYYTQKIKILKHLGLNNTAKVNNSVIYVYVGFLV